MVARILDISPEQYHKLPHFSASTAKALQDQSVLHAKYWRETGGKDPNFLLDRGGALHTWLLGKGKQVACLPYDDWRKDAAKDSRDKTRAAGLIPLTHVHYTECEIAAREIRRRLDEQGHFISQDHGISECAIEWEEQTPSGAVLCKAMLDHLVLLDDEALIYELKITEDAHPESCERTSENLGYGIACAAYIRAVAALRPDLARAGRISFRFLFCEPNEPWALHDPEPDLRFLEGGERKWLDAVAKWGRAQKTGEWPHYQATRYISRPRWALLREGYRLNE